jgi:hypothetical protein
MRLHACVQDVQEAAGVDVVASGRAENGSEITSGDLFSSF